MTDPDPPTVGGDLDGWRLREEYVETVFELGIARVEGHTAVYEDITVAERAAAAGLDESAWRFLFVTRLVFDPPLAPGVGPASVYPTVVRESAREFGDDLRERGFDRVERGRRERTRTEGGDRLRLTQYEAVYRPEGADPLDVEGWLGVWIHDGEFRLAGGAFPVGGLAGLDGATADENGRERFRDELLALIRSVE